MIVISIGTDRKLFEEKSAVRERIIAQGAFVEEMHCIVFTRNTGEFKDSQIAKNVRLYPTNSSSRIFAARDAHRIGVQIHHDRKISKNSLVISTQDPFETALASIRLKRRFGIALQIQIHTDLFSTYFKTVSLLNRIRILIAKRLLPQADEIRVVSERIKTSLIGKLHIQEQKIDVLPVFIPQNNNDKIIKKSTNSNLTILMASRLEPEKNISFALEILKKIVEKMQNVKLIIVGSGSEEKKLKQDVEKLNLNKHVEFIEWQQNLRPYYQAADIFLVTSHYEGFGMTFIEAAKDGIPIISTNVGIAPELIENNIDGYVVDSQDPALFAEKIELFLKDESLRQKARESLIKKVEKYIFNKEEYFKKYYSLLEKTVHNHNSL